MFIYKTILQPTEGLFIDKGSKFQAFVFEVNNEKEIKTRLEQIKALHPKATHHCYAYKLGLDENNYRANDDGEPSGSAGRPILGQIYSNALTNVLAIVVRYYGGTKLGVSGLINAYKKATQDAFNQAIIVEKEEQTTFVIECTFLEMNAIINHLKKIGIQHFSQNFNEICTLNVTIEKSKNDQLMLWLKNKNIKFTQKEKA
jgi:uncharacterized YigZ family protein